MADRVDRTFAIADAVKIEAAHAGLRRERDKVRVRHFVDLAPPQAEFFLCQNDNAATFGRFIGQ